MTRYFNDIEINKKKKRSSAWSNHPENTICVHFEIDIILEVGQKGGRTMPIFDCSILCLHS